MIVDDSLTVRMDIGNAFEAAGFEPVLCPDLRSAREALMRGGPALIVLDVLLPDGDGLEFLKELKDSSRAWMPVLLLSTEAEVRSRVRGLFAGANEYIGKPYDLVHVVARARALLRGNARRAPDLRRRLLVIEDSATFAEELKRALEAAGYEVQLAGTGEAGLTLAGALRPDALIVDGMLPGIDGATVVRRLKSDTALRGMPCLLLTAAEGKEEELSALEAGADAYMRKSEDLRLILVRVAALLRSAVPTVDPTSPSLLGPKRVLAVDPSNSYLQALGSSLQHEGYDVVLASSGEEALEFLAAQPVDCILLDLDFPGLSGLETCRRIKQSKPWRDIPLLILTSREDRDSMIEGINAGADDYVIKSEELDVLKARLRAQLRRQHFEHEKRRIGEALVQRETEARFQRLIHSNIIGVIRGDLQGVLSDANDAFLALVGYSRAELEAGALRWAALTPIEWHERDQAAAAQLRLTGSAVPYETELFRKDGTRLPVVLGLVSLEGVTITVGFVLDRTQQQRADEKIKRYANALEVANQELEAFSYSVAHDLRGPLRGMKGFSEVLLESYKEKLDADGVDALEEIHSNAVQMGELIDALLALSLVTRSELKPVPVDLSAMVTAAFDRLALAEPERRVEHSVDAGVWATLDPQLARTLIANLIGNAWKFTSKARGARITFGATTDNGARTFSIKDNGAGFDMEHAKKLFAPFHRLHTQSEYPGTGIGLATAQRIVHRHGGRIWAEGVRGVGAAFFFTL